MSITHQTTEDQFILLKSLLQEQSPLQQILQEMRDGVLICDAAGKILLFNDALRQLVGLSHPAIHRFCTDAIPGEELWLLIKSVLKTGNALTEEVKLGFGNQERVFKIHIVPIMLPAENQTEKPKVNGCVATFHDLTTMRKTEKMRRDFVANVSHELRTPLSAIKGYAETLLDGALEDKEVHRDFVGIIYKHSLRLSQLVEDLLDLSKLESPDYVAELEPVLLKPIVKQIHAMSESSILANQLSFHVDIPDNFPPALVNTSALEQVLTNLIDNAIKYTPGGGHITVSVAERPDSKIQVNVVDTGIGIEQKHIHRVFERFYRVDKARSRDLGGTGLGLSIVKHIVQLHGGDIWVKSIPNQGSTFSFTLKKAE